MSERIAADLRPLDVLLLEDSRFDAELLRENLLRSYPRARLTVVVDEERFTAAIRERSWHVILSDYEIPGFSGAAALALARIHRPHTPFIFVSGVIGEDNAVEMLKRGATDYVSKQRLSRLPVVLDRALREAAARDGLVEARARLREADAIYSRVVDTLRDYAVVMLDLEGRIATWNRGAEAIFGYDAAEVIGRDAAILFTAEDREAGVPAQRLAQAMSFGTTGAERWMLRKDGLQLRSDSVLAPVFSDAGEHTGFCAIVRDVTERYRTSEALLAAKEQAERASEARGQFLAVLSHELRTPLTPITAAAHVLERTAIVPPQYQHLLPMIRRNVALEARLIDDLLDLSAIGAGKLSLKLAAVDMHQVIERVADMLKEPSREGGLAIALELDAARRWVEGDEARIQQIAWNIVRNAIKFTPAGGTVTLRTSNDGTALRFECVDTGQGVPAESLERIFRPFEQGPHDPARSHGGLGLGLAIARALASEHRGTLTARSEGEGRGAVFELRLPTIDEAASATAASDPSSICADGCRLLLVEDNLDAAASMKEILELFGYVVVHAGTCADALEVARREVFDVILTDLGLPDGSGIDVGQALSERYPVVALSGYGAPPDLQRSAMAGFAGHLVKPADPQTVHAALQDALAAHRIRIAGLRQRA